MEIIANPMGSIITDVAVLEIHMERNAEEAMNPSTRKSARRPMTWMIFRAIRRWRFHLSMDKAIKKPPMKRKMIELMYDFAASPVFRIPAKGKATIGIKAVAASGASSSSIDFYRACALPGLGGFGR